MEAFGDGQPFLVQTGSATVSGYEIGPGEDCSSIEPFLCYNSKIFSLVIGIGKNCKFRVLVKRKIFHQNETTNSYTKNAF